ncbi:MAG: murein biosynthesis integral membrane protein MurJ [Schaalia turicensis]
MRFFPPRRPTGRHFVADHGADTRPDTAESAADTPATSAAAGPEPDTSAASSENNVSEKSASAARASIIMFFGTLVSRILGLVRSPILLGAVVGLTSPAGNAFGIANKLPNLIYMIIVGGLVNAVLVPAIVRATKRGEKEGAAFINKLLTVAIVGLGAVTVLITLAAPAVVKVMAATMSEDWYRLTVAWAYWCLPQIFFYGMYTVIGQILNARENFGPYMWAPALNNVVAVLGMLAILAIFGSATPEDALEAGRWTASRVGWLGGISTLGIVAQALILIWPLRRLGIHFRFDFRWRNSGLGAAGRASWWMLLMMVTSIIPTALISNAAAGASDRAIRMGMNSEYVAGNFAYDTAYTIYSLPTSLFVVSIATAVFTRISRAAADGDRDRMRRDVSRTLRIVSTIMFLAAIGLMVFAVPVSRLFAITSSAEQAVTLGKVVASMALGLFGIGAVSVLDRVYYAFEDTRGAFLISLPFQGASCVLTVFCALLPPQHVVWAVGIVGSLANIFAVIVMLWHLSPRMGGVDGAVLTSFHLKLLGISGLAAAAGYGAARLVGPVFSPMTPAQALLGLIVGGSVMVLVYVGGMKIAKMEEIDVLFRPVVKILARLRRRS